MKIIPWGLGRAMELLSNGIIIQVKQNMLLHTSFFKASFYRIQNSKRKWNNFYRQRLKGTIMIHNWISSRNFI
jgi:hypothetical protein